MKLEHFERYTKLWSLGPIFSTASVPGALQFTQYTPDFFGAMY
jgi:hypothetical protein